MPCERPWRNGKSLHPQTLRHGIRADENNSLQEDRVTRDAGKPGASSSSEACTKKTRNIGLGSVLEEKNRGTTTNQETFFKERLSGPWPYLSEQKQSETAAGSRFNHNVIMSLSGYAREGIYI
jgi:hypothetical protein